MDSTGVREPRRGRARSIYGERPANLRRAGLGGAWHGVGARRGPGGPGRRWRCDMKVPFAGVTGRLPSYVARLSRRGRERRAHLRVADALAVKARATSRDGRRAVLYDGVIADLHAF